MSYEITAQNELKNNVFYIDDTEYLVRHHECQQLLQQAIALLPPQQKQVYLLAKEEGLSHEKIAEQMALSKLTVKTHMAKALQSIRRYLNAQLNSFPLELLLAGTLTFL
jgi:RNA polymerase sigma factor (sigma-70 family)